MRARAVAASTVLITVASVLVAVWLLSRHRLVLHGRVESPDITGGGLAIAWCLTGATLAWLRPRNPVGWLLLLVGACQGLSQGLAAYGAYGIVVAQPQWPLARWSAWLGSFLWLPGLLPLVNLLPALYPDGRLPTRLRRRLAGAAAAGTALLTVAAAVDPASYDDIAPGAPPIAAPRVAVVLFVVTVPLVVASTVMIWVGSVLRMVRARAPERQQLAWLMCVVVTFVLVAAVPGMPEFVFDVAGLLIPVAVAVGVLRYGMLGIEVLLRRGLVYAVLSAGVVLAYLAVTVLTGSQLDRGPLPGLVAAALAAVALAPLRERVQAAVDRLVYGDRRDPLRALARVGDSVAAPGQALLVPTVLAAVADAVRAPGASVLRPDGSVLAAWGRVISGEADQVCFPLRVGGDEVGLLTVAPRGPADVYTEGDLRLLAALAQQAAAVVRTLQLAEALQLERDRVLAAVVEERDRLRRDLHDGLGPALAGIGLGLQAVQDERAADNDVAVQELLARLVAEVTISVGEVRRIVDGLRPAVLDSDGLVGALQRHAATLALPRQSGGQQKPLDIRVDAGRLPVLPTEVEMTAYRIAQESLTNVVRHAGARHVRVNLAADDETLRLEVADDGHGIDPARTGGIGVPSMRHRAESLSGTLDVTSTARGTTVVALLPLTERSP